MNVIKDEEFEEALNHLLTDFGFSRDRKNGMNFLRKASREADSIVGASQMTQRQFERNQREALKSSHGPTAEIHDQFYRDHKLILKLFQFLAVMPIERSEPGKVTFSWRSKASIYAFCFYTILTVIIVIVGIERLKVLENTTKFDDYIYGILFVIFLIPHFWIPFVGWGVANDVASYKSYWGTFQVRYFRVTGENLHFPGLKMQIIIISIGCLLCAIVFIMSLSILLEGFPLWQTSAYYHVMTMLNMNSALWYINSRGIKIASESLSSCFRKDVEIECNANMISKYRFLWLNLSELLQSLGNAYARTYSTYCLFMLFNITIAIYGTFSGVIDHGFLFSFKEIGLIVDVVYCSVLLYIFCDCSHTSTQQVAQGVQDTLLSINTLSVDTPTQKEIDIFIQAIAMNPAIVSLRGYAEVNRELLTSSIATITIYLIVLIQFKLSLLQQQMWAAEGPNLQRHSNITANIVRQ